MLVDNICQFTLPRKILVSNKEIFAMTSTGQRHLVLVLTFLMFSWLLGFSSTSLANFDTWTKNAISNAPAENVLLKISFAGEVELHRLLKSELVVRYQDRDFVIAQVDSQRLSEMRLPSYTIIDKIQPGAQYYFVRAKTPQILTLLEDVGDVLLTFDRLALLRGDVHTAEVLLEQRFLFSPLLDKVVTLPERIRLPMRSVRASEEVIADTASIQQLVASVDPEKIRATIYDLQENVEIDPPHIPYRSRFTLRVKNTDNPSDEALDNAAEYIFRKFQSYGLLVEYDPFNMQNPSGIQGNYEANNVVATLSGTGPNKDLVYIICGHYDSIASNSSGLVDNWKTMEAPGADDNASGTAGVLEAAKVLSQEKFDLTIKFIAFAGEELGHFGSRHYANTAKGKEEIIGVLNMDMIGNEPDVMDMSILKNDRSEWLARAMSAAGRDYKIDLIITEDITPLGVLSDHASFWDAGFSAVWIFETKDFTPPEYSLYLHTTADTVDKLNIEFASRITQLTVATVAELANPANVDLAVYSDEVRFSTDMPRRGEKVTLMANVHNTGAVDAENVIVEVRLGELSGWFKLDKIKEERISVKAGEVKNISASFSLTELGEYEVSVRLNPDSTIKEKDFRNNVASKEIILFYTDLSVKAEDIRFSNVHPAYLQDVTMTALIRNVGHDDAIGTSVEVRLLSPSVTDVSKARIISEEEVDIKAGDAKEIAASFALRKWGVYTIYIEVNRGDRDEEVNPDDNEVMKTITLSPPDLVVEAGSIQFSNPTPKKGEQVSVILQIGNLGEGDSPPTSVQILLTNPGTDKPQMISEQRVEIEAKGKKEISAFLPLPIWGKYEVTVQINPKTDVLETDFGNNEAKGTLVVSSALAMERITVYPNPVHLSKDGQVRLYYELSKDADVVFEVYTVLGELVFKSEFAGKREGGSIGPNRIAWQGVNSNGERIASGVYICRLVVTDGQMTLTKLKKMALFR